MMIKVIDVAKAKAPDFSSSYEDSDLSTDINFFNSAMTPTSRPNTAVSQPPQNLLTDVDTKLTSVAERMTRSLRALSSTNKLEEARKYPSQLSDALLLTHMLTKSIGKTAQGIDKISNLQ
ncbi:hypothetical protein [Pseudomonas sp.]|jgi:hypothetical protein|uniref:hypothetical protein n=1 Tax=Pseudomonas sp. TaxID=306 RepID=UPI003D701EA1